MAEPAVRHKPMTFAEAARLDPDEFPGEVVNGEWIPVTRSTWRHGEVAGNAYALLRGYARKHGGWRVSLNDPGVKLARNPDTLRGPDVAAIRAERVPEGRGEKGWLEGGPEVAVEVLGDSQSAAAMVQKGLEYLQAGSLMVWILNADAEQLILMIPPDQRLVLNRDDTLEGGEVLPGFTCRVSELFE